MRIYLMNSSTKYLIYYIRYTSQFHLHVTFTYKNINTVTSSRGLTENVV